MDNRAVPVVVEELFNKPIETVWSALTERDQMVLWFFTSIPDFKAEAGFSTSFVIESGGRRFDHLWNIVEAEAPSKITYHWSYTGIPGAGTVLFELFEQSDGTLLRITNKGLESFPEDIPEFRRESCVAGWEYFIKGNLKHYLEPN